MPRLTILIFVLSCFVSQDLFGQLKSTFRVGLNFSRISGPSEQDDAGNDLEKLKANTGFHVGGGIIYKFLENYGVKGEVLFSQKGGKVIYEGPSEYVFNTVSGSKIVAVGNRRTNTSVTNSYIELPITAYVKFADKRLEFFGGASFNFLVLSSAVGERVFSGVLPSGTPVDQFILNLDYNYKSDELFNANNLDANAQFVNFFADGQEVSIPLDQGAYFDFEKLDGNFYNSFDVALIAGLNFFLNKGLFVGVALNYGLTDVSNDFYNYNRLKANGTELVPRVDHDNNFVIQASVGFSF